MFAKFYEIPSMILEVITETKRYGHTDGRSDNVKTVYPPTNTVCGGYNEGTRVLTRFSPLLVYGNFFKHSRAAYSAALGRMGLKFNLILDFIYIFLTCKNEDDPIKNEGARVLTRLYFVCPDVKGS